MTRKLAFRSQIVSIDYTSFASIRKHARMLASKRPIFFCSAVIRSKTVVRIAALPSSLRSNASSNRWYDLHGYEANAFMTDTLENAAHKKLLAACCGAVLSVVAAVLTSGAAPGWHQFLAPGFGLC